MDFKRLGLEIVEERREESGSMTFKLASRHNLVIIKNMFPLHQEQAQAEVPVGPLSRSTYEKRDLKVVSFESIGPTQVQRIATPNQDELQTRWYSKQEYADIRASVVKAIRNPGEECTRGLEMMTTEGVAHRKQTKCKVLVAVWNCQVKQWNEQNRIYDPESIALAYQQETFHCVQLAWILGQMDQQAAMQEYQSLLFSNNYFNRQGSSSQGQPSSGKQAEAKPEKVVAAPPRTAAFARQLGARTA